MKNLLKSVFALCLLTSAVLVSSCSDSYEEVESEIVDEESAGNMFLLIDGPSITGGSTASYDLKTNVVE